MIITKNIQLSHKCKGKAENINFPFDKKINSYTPMNGYYSNNKTSDICLECKKYICKICQNVHISKPIEENIILLNLIGSKIKEEEDTNYFCIDKEIQFFCNEHFIKYEYFGLIAKKTFAFIAKISMFILNVNLFLIMIKSKILKLKKLILLMNL